jgi:hypothetical protein
MTTEITRHAFSILDEREKREALRAGVRVVDDPPRARASLPTGGALSRLTFDKLSEVEKRQAIKAGRQIVDGPGAEEHEFPTVPPQPGHRWKRTIDGSGFVQVTADE